MNMDLPKDEFWSSVVFRMLSNTVTHPIEYAKVLIQIGYEPIPPRPTTTLFRQPVLALPNVLQYVAYIKSVDGFRGCYCGLVPKLCSYTISAVVFEKTSDWWNRQSNSNKKCDENNSANEQSSQSRDDQETLRDEAYTHRLDESESSDEVQRLETERNSKNGWDTKKLISDLISRSVAIIISHPLDVIALRMMAQFVGRETKYNGLFSSFVEVCKENGIMGYYAGIVPRLIGNAGILVLVSSSTYLINKYIVHDEMQSYTSSSMGFIASVIMYPFFVVSHTMAVNNCGLAAGLPPHMPIYNDWLDCWSHLSATNQLKRGSSLFRRYYTGPTNIKNGYAVPVQGKDNFKLYPKLSQ